MIIDKGVVEVGAYYTYIIVGFGLLFQKINENKYNKVFLYQIKGLYLLYNNNNNNELPRKNTISITNHRLSYRSVSCYVWLYSILF